MKGSPEDLRQKTSATKLVLSTEQYNELEGGGSSAEEWGPRLASIATKLKTPMSRLISQTGKSSDGGRTSGQCGLLIQDIREKRGLSQEDLGMQLKIAVAELAAIEEGRSPIEECDLLRFAEIIDQPIFNLFYPCGLPLDHLTDYP